MRHVTPPPRRPVRHPDPVPVITTSHTRACRLWCAVAMFFTLSPRFSCCRRAIISRTWMRCSGEGSDAPTYPPSSAGAPCLTPSHSLLCLTHTRVRGTGFFASKCTVTALSTATPTRYSDDYVHERERGQGDRPPFSLPPTLPAHAPYRSSTLTLILSAPATAACGGGCCWATNAPSARNAKR